MQVVNLREAPPEFRLELVRELGYSVAEDGVHLIKDRKQASDPYTNVPLRIDNLAVLPGSVVLLDNDPVGIALYLEEHGEVL